MDVAGARALADRIAEHRTRSRGMGDERHSARAHARPGIDLLDVQPRAAIGARDLRMYTTDVHMEDVDGRPTAVTVVRCRRVVDGHWETRVVEVDVGPRRDSV
jgi:hypothetical protein